MISKATISEIRQLHQLKHRREQNLFIAEGVKVVTELLDSPLKIKLIACTDDFRVTHSILPDKAAIISVTEKELSRISMLQTPNQVVAVAEIPSGETPDFGSKKGNLLVLDGIRDPGNMGTIIRSAEWFGIQQVICSDDCVDAFNPKVVQGAMGSLFRMNIYYENLELQLQKARKEGGYAIYGADAHGIPYPGIKKDNPWVLVIGSESHGISPSLQSFLDHKISIPKASGVKTESLNAAVAAAVLLASFSSINNQ